MKPLERKGWKKLLRECISWRTTEMLPVKLTNVDCERIRYPAIDPKSNPSGSQHALIADIVLSSQTHDILNKPRDIFILDKNRMPAEDVSLLYASAKVILTGDGRTMTEQIDCRSDLPLPRLRSFTGGQPEAARPAAFEEPELNIFNGLGGFSPDGNEYVIRLQKGQTTPAPWVNIIANPEFGFIVSEAGSGYAWYGNSRENKLTPWSNDAVSDTPGEVLYIGDRDTGRLWTVTSLPIRENEPYTIRHAGNG